LNVRAQKTQQAYRSACLLGCSTNNLYIAPAELRRPLREPPERPPDDPPRPLLLLDDDDRLPPALPRPELMLLPPLRLRVVDLPRPPDLPPPLELPRFAAMTSPN
jgi:hypothetical protein